MWFSVGRTYEIFLTICSLTLQTKIARTSHRYTVAESVVFQTLMMILIVVNTISLSSEGYHTNEEDQDVLNSINLGCTVVFGIEIIVLIVAYVVFDPLYYYGGALSLSSQVTRRLTLE